MDTLRIIQVTAGLLWLVAAIFYSGSVMRIYAGRAAWVDVFRALFVFIGLTQFGFTVRWLIFPGTIPDMGKTELTYWTLLYLMSAIEALALVVASYFSERLKGSKRLN